MITSIFRFSKGNKSINVVMILNNEQNDKNTFSELI